MLEPGAQPQPHRPITDRGKSRKPVAVVGNLIVLLHNIQYNKNKNDTIDYNYNYSTTTYIIIPVVDKPTHRARYRVRAMVGEHRLVRWQATQAKSKKGNRYRYVIKVMRFK